MGVFSNLIPDRIPRRDDGSIDFMALNSYMCYKDSNLESTRFSAWSHLGNIYLSIVNYII